MRILKVKPTNKEELKDLIKDAIYMYGYECDLNFIDTSEITNMTSLFRYSQFNGDISKWDTSNVKNMLFMFEDSDFNGDISEWNTSNVIDMFHMFFNSSFNGDISQWNISKVTDMRDMFYNCNLLLQNKLPEWYKDILWDLV